MSHNASAVTAASGPVINTSLNAAHPPRMTNATEHRPPVARSEWAQKKKRRQAKSENGNQTKRIEKGYYLESIPETMPVTQALRHCHGKPNRWNKGGH
jgi:hypothetical protein